MAIRLYVGGLSFDTNDAELKAFFEQAGTVQTATVVADHYTGRSKGFGFVEMASDEDARKAISELNGKTLGDRTIRVEESRSSGPGERRPGGGGGRPRGGGGGGGSRGGGYGGSRRW
jgi:RNA recognition motif-containing protein